MVIFTDHALQESEVIGRKLTDTLVQGVCNISIWCNFTLNNLLDIGLTLCHVEAKLREIAQHQLLVRKELLILHQISNLAFADLIILTWSLRQDCQGVKVFLTIKEDIKTASLVLFHGKSVG